MVDVHILVGALGQLPLPLGRQGLSAPVNFHRSRANTGPTGASVVRASAGASLGSNFNTGRLLRSTARCANFSYRYLRHHDLAHRGRGGQIGHTCGRIGRFVVSLGCPRSARCVPYGGIEAWLVDLAAALAGAQLAHVFYTVTRLSRGRASRPKWLDSFGSRVSVVVAHLYRMELSRHSQCRHSSARWRYCPHVFVQVGHQIRHHDRALGAGTRLVDDQRRLFDIDVNHQVS
mmetsp:Transcript_40181/g.69572  ORF Transcript_40181/g.69572 Transcript_40181/m.69572 type:complete len:232 (+) Transcript_40181:220-915(+)